MFSDLLLYLLLEMKILIKLQKNYKKIILMTIYELNGSISTLWNGYRPGKFDQ